MLKQINKCLCWLFAHLVLSLGEHILELLANAHLRIQNALALMPCGWLVLSLDALGASRHEASGAIVQQALAGMSLAHQRLVNGNLLPVL